MHVFRKSITSLWATSRERFCAKPSTLHGRLYLVVSRGHSAHVDIAKTDQTNIH